MRHLLLTILLCFPVSANDKVDHFLAGAVIGAAVNVSFRWSGGSRLQSARIGFVVGTGAGITKEVIDQYAYDTAKRLDAAYAGNAQTSTYAKKGIGAFGRGAEAGDALATCLGAAFGSWAVQKVWR